MPYTSEQINGLISGGMQSNQLMQQQAMAGLPMGGPQPMLGPSQWPPAMGPPQAASLGGYTGMGNMAMPFQQSGFSYGMPQGAGMGSYMAGGIGGAAQAVPGMMTTASMGAGTAMMFGASGYGLGAAAMLDPIGMGMTGAMAGWGAGGVAGAVGMGAATGGLGLLAFEGIRQTGKHFSAGIQQQVGLNAQLSQYGFGNVGAQTGRGFAPGQQRAIGEAMRGFAAADPFTTMKDMSGLMDQFSEMGMGQGIRDAEEFSTKFTKMAETMRTMAMAMGKSLEEVGPMFREFRQAGFYTAADVMGNTQQMGMLQGMGMNQQTYTGLQQQGSQFTRSQQMTSISGARAVTGLAGMLMMNPGNEQQLMDITGGADLSEAAGMMSQDVMQKLTRFMNEGAGGREFLAAFGETDAEGRFTGGVDAGLMARAGRGEVDWTQLGSMGREKVGTGKGRQSFEHSYRDISASMLQQEDMLPAIMRIIRSEAGEDEDIAALTIEQLTGIDRRSQEVLMGEVEDWASTRREMRSRLREEIGAEVMQAEISRNRSIGGISQRVGGTIADLWAPVEQAGADITAASDEAVMGASDRFWEISRTGVTSGGLQANSFEAVRQGGFGAAMLSGDGATLSGGQLAEFRRAERERLRSTATGYVGGGVGMGTAGRTRGGGTPGSYGKGKATLGTAVGGVLGAEGLVAVGDVAAMGGITERNIGGLLGIEDETALMGTVESLRGGGVQDAITRAQMARRDGRSGDAKREEEIVREKIAGAMGADPDNLSHGQLRDIGFITAQLGGTDIVAAELAEGAGQVLDASAFGDAESAKIALIQESEDLGLSTDKSWDRHAMTAFNVATLGVPSWLGLVDTAIESDVQFLVDGGPGSRTLAAIGEDEEKLSAFMKTIHRYAGKEGSEEAVLEAARRFDPSITPEDAAAAAKTLLNTDVGKRQTLTKFAKRAEFIRVGGEQAREAATAFGGLAAATGIGTEVQDVQFALRNRGGGSEILELLRATKGKGNIDELRALGPMGQALAQTVEDIEAAGGAQDVASVAKAFGIKEGDVAYGEIQKMADEMAQGKGEGSLAERVGSGVVLSAASAGTTGVTFGGGLDPESQRLKIAEQIMANSELIVAVYNKMNPDEKIDSTQALHDVGQQRPKK